ncbi:MAG: DUF4386 domain-containing protein [Chloroflexi bacterium]|nr:DUF4386 domain-containing protein [Chloroflexota bacterium]
MKTERRIALWIGVLYIIGTVAGVLSVVSAGSPLLSADDYLTEIADNENQMVLGALFVLIMGVSLALIPAIAYPVLKQHNEILAVGYVIFRGALETLTYVVTVLIWLVLVPISQEYVKAADGSSYEALGDMLIYVSKNAATMTALIFPIGALMLYAIFYQSKLTPRWVSMWGIIAVSLYIPAALLDMFDVVTQEDSTFTLMMMPMFLQEMVMAVWLIVKGFNRSSAEPAKVPNAEMSPAR